MFNLGCVQIASPVCGADGLLLGCTGLGTLGSVFGATLCAVLDTCGIESAADDVVTHTGKVLYTAATNEDDGVLLQIVALARDVGVDFLAVGKTDTGYFAHSRVRLLGGRRVHTDAHAATLGARVESRALALVFQGHAAFTY